MMMPIATNFNAVVSDKLTCMPAVLQGLVCAYMPPAPTSEALRALAKEILEAGKTVVDAVPEVLRDKADDAVPYIEGAVVSFRAVNIIFQRFGKVEEAGRYRYVADVMRLLFQLLPGTTIEMGTLNNKFWWREYQLNPYRYPPTDETALMGEYYMSWAKVKEVEPKLEYAVMEMPVAAEEIRQPVEYIEIGTRTALPAYNPYPYWPAPALPPIAPLFEPQRPPRPGNPDLPGIPDGPDAPNFRGQSLLDDVD